MGFTKITGVALGLTLLSNSYAFEPSTQKVSYNVYAIVGELDQRSADLR